MMDRSGIPINMTDTKISDNKLQCLAIDIFHSTNKNKRIVEAIAYFPNNFEKVNKID